MSEKKLLPKWAAESSLRTGEKECRSRPCERWGPRGIFYPNLCPYLRDSWRNPLLLSWVLDLHHLPELVVLFSLIPLYSFFFFSNSLYFSLWLKFRCLQSPLIFPSRDTSTLPQVLHFALSSPTGEKRLSYRRAFFGVREAMVSLTDFYISWMPSFYTLIHSSNLQKFEIRESI